LDLTGDHRVSFRGSHCPQNTRISCEDGAARCGTGAGFVSCIRLFDAPSALLLVSDPLQKASWVHDPPNDQSTVSNTCHACSSNEMSFLVSKKRRTYPQGGNRCGRQQCCAGSEKGKHVV
jgi:hypothetical protein